MREVLPLNRTKFPYSRGHHYFFDLTMFPRVEGSHSYASDKTNVFNSTYSQENAKIGEARVGELINRNFFGLPFDNKENSVSKDKNICHSFLFSNEDRKYNIDRALAELKFILKHFEDLISKKKLHRYKCLDRDIDLEGVKD